MDRLMWSSTKSQLHLVEVAYVKEAVGRDRIQRSKDALRELGCLQEILAELHAGALLGRPEIAPGTLDAALSRWSALQHEAGNRGVPLDAVCSVPAKVRRFLLVQPSRGLCGASSSFSSTRCVSDTAASTRAPSTSAALDLEPDVGSVTTVTESPAQPEGGNQLFSRPVHCPRMSRLQLGELAAVLREQLDQEYTSLLASIDEVQALMEAEVDVGLALPSSADLEAFIATANSALKPCDKEEAALLLQRVWRGYVVRRRVCDDSHAQMVAVLCLQRSWRHFMSRQCVHQLQGLCHTDAAAAAALRLQIVWRACLAKRCVFATRQRRACDSAPVFPKSAAPARHGWSDRPRWSDLTDSETEECVPADFSMERSVSSIQNAQNQLTCDCSSRSGLTHSDAAIHVQTVDCVNDSSTRPYNPKLTAPQLSQCCMCAQWKPRTSFSRRAWQRARQKSTGDSDGTCIECSVEPG